MWLEMNLKNMNQAYCILVIILPDVASRMCPVQKTEKWDLNWHSIKDISH